MSNELTHPKQVEAFEDENKQLWRSKTAWLERWMYTELNNLLSTTEHTQHGFTNGQPGQSYMRQAIQVDTIVEKRKELAVLLARYEKELAQLS